ncbi:LysR substrate-binding domain-containing protein [Shewanella waksmanii]|uniref:LysR substrate-binding domain-containing protein n=1 Tax=Shewanella waksmanii TaxID=213783 RepID=UPI003736431C
MENLDLRSMRILLDLYHTHNTYQTAENMQVSQSLVSRTLAKSRQALNDPLFVCQGKQLCPTQLMHALAIELPVFTARLNDIVMQSAFNPAKLSGHYQLFVGAQLPPKISTALAERLSTLTPNASWTITDWQSQAIENLINQQVTLGIDYINHDLPSVITQDRIANDKLVIWADKQHPIHNVPHVTMEQLTQYEFISLPLNASDKHNSNRLEHTLDSQPSITAQIHTDSVALAAQIAHNQSLLFVGSQILSDDHHPSLKIVKLADSCCSSFDIALTCAYSANQAKDPLIIWLTTILKEMISPLYNPSTT